MPQVEPTAAPKGPVNLTVAWWGPPGQTYAYELCLQDYKDKNPNVSFEIVSPGDAGGYTTKIMTMVGAGAPPDVLLMENSSLTGGRFLPFAAAGVVADLTDACDKANIKESDFVPGSWANSSLNGKLYGIPYVSNIQAICYNADLFEAAGQPTPRELYDQGKWDYEHFVAAAQALTNPDKKIYGVTPWRWSMQGFVQMYGGCELSPDGKKITLTDPKTIKGYEALYDLTTKYKVAPTTSEAEAAGNMWGIFAAQQSAMMIQGNWDLLGAENNMKFNYDYVPHPAGPAGRFVWAFTGQWGMSADSKNKESAFDLLQALTSVEGMKLATIMKVGRTCARQEVVDKYYYDTWRGKNVKAFVDSFPCGRNAPFLDGILQTFINAELDLVMEGKQTVAEALAKAEPKCQAELDKGEIIVQVDKIMCGEGCK